MPDHANYLPSAAVPCSAKPDAGDVEELLEILGREEVLRGFLAPDPEEVPFYDPEALVW